MVDRMWRRDRSSRNSLDFVHNFVDVNAIGVGLLFVVTIAARVQQHFGVLVLLRIQHVVAAKLENIVER